MFLAVLLTACLSKPIDMKKAILEGTIEVGVGEEFEIGVSANPSTGRRWEIIQGSLDEDLVEFVSRKYKSNDEPGMVGGGGVETWTFKAIYPGEATILLGHYRPSNKPTDPEQTQTFYVSIK